MLAYQLVRLLDENKSAALKIILPTGETVPDHFHVTEVGKVNKVFVDCGGVCREENHLSVQVWTADDRSHRLPAGKLSDILNVAQDTFGLGELPVHFEYGNDLISNYKLTSVEITRDGLLFRLERRKTDCLAKDKCGVGKKCC